MKKEITEELVPVLPAAETEAGFMIRPGLFQVSGAVPVPGGVSFTISSRGADSCELCLFHRNEGWRPFFCPPAGQGSVYKIRNPPLCRSRCRSAVSPSQRE